MEKLELVLTLRFKGDVHPYEQQILSESTDEFEMHTLYQTVNNLLSYLSKKKLKAEVDIVKRRANEHTHPNSPCRVDKKIGDKIKWTCGVVE